MLRNMVTSLIYHERIMTTTPRAKELRRVAEKMIQHAKIGTMHHRRIAGGFVQTLPALTKLFEILGPRYMNRPGGYTRIMKLALPRRGDSADMSYIEFVDRQGELRTARPAKQPFKRTEKQEESIRVQGRWKSSSRESEAAEKSKIEEVD